MESLILKAINHSKLVSKKKVNVKNCQRSSTSNLDNNTLQVEIDQMIRKGLIDENYNIMNKDNLNITKEPLFDEVYFELVNDTEENYTGNCVSLVLRLATLKGI